MSKIIDLKAKELSFTRDNYLYKLEFFRVSSMNIETLCYKNNTFIKKETIPFAQLPKVLKKEIKPNK